MDDLCVLFGAGAEIQLGVSGGADFAKVVLGIEQEELNTAVRKHYTDKLQQLKTREAQNPLTEMVQWYPDRFHLDAWNTSHLVEASIRKMFLDQQERSIIELELIKCRDAVHHYLSETEAILHQDKDKENIDFKQEIKILDDAILSAAYFNKSDYEDIIKAIATILSHPGFEYYQNDLIAHYTSYMGLLDEHFHTLIYPRVLGPYKFWRVVTSYARAYTYLLHEMSKEIEGKYGNISYTQILDKPELSISIQSEYCKSKINHASYYSILRNTPRKASIRVITTNYTSLCHEIGEIGDDQIAYIHGKFGWFESARDLLVYDINDDTIELPQDILFPYIFIQSGVKPIIDMKQIREYAKMSSFLERARTLLIVGYRINSDDNHVASVIKSFLTQKDKRVLYLDYSGSIGENNLKARLRLKPGEANSLTHIKTGPENCLSMFEQILSNY